MDSEAQLDDAAAKIVGFADDQRIWLFHGEMGSGKTTLIKHLCKKLHVEDNISSPSFQIINEYQRLEHERILHFDFYRIKDPIEALNLGVDEFFESGDLCMIEWPEKIMSLLPDRFLNIHINVVSENQRKILLSQNG